jgi:hypothetical protein
MTTFIENLDSYDNPYQVFNYRHKLIKKLWSRTSRETRRNLYNLIKIYKISMDYELNQDMIYDCIEYQEIVSRGFWENKVLSEELNTLGYSITTYNFVSENECARQCEAKLQHKINKLSNGIMEWFQNVFEDDVFECNRCQEVFPDEDFDSNYEVCGACADCYREEEEEEYPDEESCYPHERYCSNYSTRVEERIDVQHLEDEIIDTNLSTTKALLYGVELEVMARNSMPESYPETLTDYNSWFMCKSDGSLEEGEGGFEICTAPSTYKFLKDRFSQMFNSGYWTDENGSTYVKGWNTSCAGLHIHINKKALRPLEVGKLLVFINEKKNKRFIEDIAGRNMNRWCKSEIKNVKDGQYQNDDRYQAVNTSNSNTVELRIFRSNVSEYGFMRALEFTDALIHYLKQTSLREQSLQYKSFVSFMRRPEVRCDYPNFWNWLITNGYVLGTPSRTVSKQFESVSNG